MELRTRPMTGLRAIPGRKYEVQRGKAVEKHYCYKQQLYSKKYKSDFTVKSFETYSKLPCYTECSNTGARSKQIIYTVNHFAAPSAA